MQDARWREETSDSAPFLAIKNINVNKVYSFKKHLNVFTNAWLVLCNENTLLKKPHKQQQLVRDIIGYRINVRVIQETTVQLLLDTSLDNHRVFFFKT